MPQKGQIAIGSMKKVSVWATVQEILPDGSIRFWVINGAWEGIIDLAGNIWDTFQDERNEKIATGVILWRGIAPFSSYQYNEAIAWIEMRIDKWWKRMAYNIADRLASLVGWKLVVRLERTESNKRPALYHPVDDLGED